eukprot:TRINITY_DN3635_c0_g1_i1.p1 TRINITY_DN3635_c0_g1~~TRINITY_DN3635_c0_g1_i1.p1  ORF type:complete len:127 (+),score=45.11 TRINITY_DN3635_c0_g1_i1:356-736(+)
MHTASGDEMAVTHMKFSAGSIFVSHRDFVSFVGRSDKSEDSMSVVCKSVAYPVPEEKGFVRGELQTSCFIFKKEDRGVLVNYIAQVDPKGWVPTAVVNAVAKTQPLILISLKKLYNEEFKGKHGSN